MSYYPILTAPDSEGFTVLHNFPPNNWEISSRGPKYVNATTISEGVWTSKTIGFLDHMESKTYTRFDVGAIEGLCLLSLTEAPLPEVSPQLPNLKSQTFIPNWRATLGLRRKDAVVSYQGEIEAFPAKASLLTSGLMLQHGQNVENYILLINVEKEPVSRSGELRLFDANNMSSPLATFGVENNKINIIPFDQNLFHTGRLPIIACNEMTGIPLYFSCLRDSSALSLEHTHPPMSLAIHGNRLGVQRLIKSFWFGKMNHD